jgi:hypothetical protein
MDPVFIEKIKIYVIVTTAQVKVNQPGTRPDAGQVTVSLTGVTA